MYTTCELRNLVAARLCVNRNIKSYSSSSLCLFFYPSGCRVLPSSEQDHYWTAGIRYNLYQGTHGAWPRWKRPAVNEHVAGSRGALTFRNHYIGLHRVRDACFGGLEVSQAPFVMMSTLLSRYCQALVLTIRSDLTILPCGGTWVAFCRSVIRCQSRFRSLSSVGILPGGDRDHDQFAIAIFKAQKKHDPLVIALSGVYKNPDPLVITLSKNHKNHDQLAIALFVARTLR